MEIRKLAPGDRILDYRILERLGEGGFGEVFRAEHEVLGSIVAIKVPRDGTGLTALRHEGVVQASLDHEHIVRTRELSISYDPPYIVMDYVDGDSLAELLRREGALSWRRALRILLPVARALDYAHGRGVVHGDVKPANILVEPGREGRVLLTDFGLGRVFEGPQGNLQISRSLELATSGAEVQGTIRYLAPELLRGESADERADVYSFAVLLFEALTGGLPEGREVPSDLVPKVPSDLDEVFASLFTRREKRPRGLGTTITQLERILDGEGLSTAPAPVPAPLAPNLPLPSAPLPPAPLASPMPTPTLVARNQVMGFDTVPTRTEVKPQALVVQIDTARIDIANEVVQAVPADAPETPLAQAASDPIFQDWRDRFLARVRNDMRGKPGIEVCEGRGFDLCYGVTTPGEPQHRVYLLCLPRMDSELALAAAEEARAAFEEEKGIWEKEVTFWIVSHELDDKPDVVWTFKSFCMGWWRRRRMVLQTPQTLLASELGCDPKGNHLKRAVGLVTKEALEAMPLVSPVADVRGAVPRRMVRGAAWGASVALMMICGLLGSLAALELATHSMRKAQQRGVAPVTTHCQPLEAADPACLPLEVAPVGSEAAPIAPVKSASQPAPAQLGDGLDHVGEALEPKQEAPKKKGPRFF